MCHTRFLNNDGRRKRDDGRRMREDVLFSMLKQQKNEENSKKIV